MITVVIISNNRATLATDYRLLEKGTAIIHAMKSGQGTSQPDMLEHAVGAALIGDTRAQPV